MTLRLFIAVDVSEEPRRALVGLCHGPTAARWTRPEQLHLTLRFLGATPEESLPDLRDRLARVRAARFTLSARGVGVFPPPPARRPAQVLWAGVAPEAPLAALKHAIDAELGPDAEADARGFHPHVTLARFRTRPGPDLAAYLAAHAAFATPPFPVDAFHLYRSTLGPDGALHEVIATYPLQS